MGSLIYLYSNIQRFRELYQYKLVIIWIARVSTCTEGIVIVIKNPQSPLIYDYQILNAHKWEIEWVTKAYVSLIC